VVDELGRACSTNGRRRRRRRRRRRKKKKNKKKMAYGLFMGNPEGRRPLERSSRRWVNNIMLGLAEIGWGDVNWIGLAQDRDK
jgi:hypothetical protein